MVVIVLKWFSYCLFLEKFLDGFRLMCIFWIKEVWDLFLEFYCILVGEVFSIIRIIWCLILVIDESFVV